MGNGGGQAQANARIESALARIEGKLDLLIEALAEDEDKPEKTLDGDPAGAPRDPNASLG